MVTSEDQLFITQVLAGNTAAFEHLVRKYQDMVFTLAVRVLNHHEEAEEVAQDVFVKVFHSLSGFQQKSNFKTWIYRITCNESINRLRSKKNKISMVNLEEGLTSGFYDQNQNLETDEEKKIVQQALLTLSETERVMVTLYYYDDMSIKDIATITEMTETNVKTKLFRSRQKLYEILKDQYSLFTSIIQTN
jgi:RNA polymerase sigma-70 factor (ECF subfamily)